MKTLLLRGVPDAGLRNARTYQRGPRRTWPGALKWNTGQRRQFNGNQHGFPGRASSIDRSLLTPAERFAKGMWIKGARP